MNWNISAWSIRTPVPSLVLFMVLIALGYVSFGQLSVTRFPNIDLPIVQVRVYQSGAAPSELEVQVTRKIEDAIAGVNGVKHQTSAVTDGARAPGMTPEELSWFVDDVVVRALQGVKAVSQIERFGGVEREIRVSLD